MGVGSKQRIEDQARFTLDDPAEVVFASFACGVCLASSDLLLLGGDPGARHGTSHCHSCGTVNRVQLSDEQTDRLWNLQRGRTFVHFAPECW